MAIRKSGGGSIFGAASEPVPGCRLGCGERHSSLFEAFCVETVPEDWQIAAAQVSSSLRLGRTSLVEAQAQEE